MNADSHCQATPLFEDADILVVNKPGGLATQAPRQFDSLEARVRSYLLKRTPPDRTPYLGIPHRLDRCASGVLVFAKRIKAARRLARQFERREVTKQYVTVVSGVVDPQAATWRDYVRKIPQVARAEVVCQDHPAARLAVLHYTVVFRTDTTSMLQIRLETGRMHQIRLQTASRGFPIIGDQAYGSDELFGPVTGNPRDRWIALHAAELSFQHPRSRDTVHFIAPLPSFWPPQSA